MYPQTKVMRMCPQRFEDVSSTKRWSLYALLGLTLLPKCFYNYYICSVILILIVILYLIFSAVAHTVSELTFSHCQALNLPFRKFVICHLSSSQNFVNSIFTSTNLWTVIFLSLHCQAFTNKTYVYFFFPFFSNIWTSILHNCIDHNSKLSCTWQHKFNRSNWV